MSPLGRTKQWMSIFIVAVMDFVSLHSSHSNWLVNLTVHWKKQLPDGWLLNSNVWHMRLSMLTDFGQLTIQWSFIVLYTWISLGVQPGHWTFVQVFNDLTSKVQIDVQWLFKPNAGLNETLFQSPWLCHLWSVPLIHKVPCTLELDGTITSVSELC